MSSFDKILKSLGPNETGEDMEEMIPDEHEVKFSLDLDGLEVPEDALAGADE